MARIEPGLTDLCQSREVVMRVNLCLRQDTTSGRTCIACGCFVLPIHAILKDAAPEPLTRFGRTDTPVCEGFSSFARDAAVMNETVLICKGWGEFGRRVC